MLNSGAQPASTPFDIKLDPPNESSPQPDSSTLPVRSDGRSSSDEGAATTRRPPVHPRLQDTPSYPAHPITRLPSEVLAQIFRHCLPCTPDPPTFSTRHAPLLLTHVSASWRKLALETPALWDAITVPPPSSSGSGSAGLAAHDVRLVRVFLRRSGTRKLSIDLGMGSLGLGNVDEVVYPFHTPQTRVEQVEKIVEALVPHTERIRVLENVSMSQLLQRFTLARLKTLEHLLVTKEHNPRAFSYPSPSSSPSKRGDEGVAGFPETLKVLDLYSTRLDLGRLPPPRGLTELYVREPIGTGRLSVMKTIELLSALNALEICSLDIDVVPSYPSSSDGAKHLLTLSRLTGLRLKWDEGIDVGPLLDVLKAPRLSSLTLWAHHTTRTPWAELHGFAERCHSPITILSLIGPGPIDGGFVECLRIWRDLESLTLAEYELDTAFLDALTPKPPSLDSSDSISQSDMDSEEDPLVPFLEYLDLEWCTFPDFEAFVCLLEARGKRDDVPGNRLEYFRMSTNALTKEELHRVENCGIENVQVKRY